MIILMGIKHSGKTSLGKMTAEILSLPFRDLDDLLEKEYSDHRELNFREIYKKLGEQGFRELETRAMHNINIKEKCILALGGGTIDNPEAIEIVKKADLLVFLDADEKVLFERIKRNGFPSFLSKSPEKLFHKLFFRRRQLYREIADISLKITNESPDELLQILLKNKAFSQAIVH